MYESLTGKQIMGYQILEKVRQEQDWQEYRAVKEGVTGRLLRTMEVAYYPPQSQIHEYLEGTHAKMKEVQEYFALCLQEILHKLSKLQLLSEMEDNHLLPIYESDVEWNNKRHQYMIYMIREEALSLPEWENNQNITVEMLLAVGEQMLSSPEVHNRQTQFDIGDIYVLSKNKFSLGNLEKYVIFGTRDRENNSLLSVYHSYIHTFYEKSQEQWEQKTTEEKRTIEILCFLHFYLQGKNIRNAEQDSKVSKKLWELLVFCTQTKIVSGEIAKRIAKLSNELDDSEKEEICVSQRGVVSTENKNRGGITFLKERFHKGMRKNYKIFLTGAALVSLLSTCYFFYQSKIGIRLKNIKKEANHKTEYNGMNSINKINLSETEWTDSINEKNTLHMTNKAETEEKSNVGLDEAGEDTTQMGGSDKKEEEKKAQKNFGKNIEKKISESETQDVKDVLSQKQHKNNQNESRATESITNENKITQSRIIDSSTNENPTKINHDKRQNDKQDEGKSENQSINQMESQQENQSEREGWEIQWE